MLGFLDTPEGGPERRRMLLISTTGCPVPLLLAGPGGVGLPTVTVWIELAREGRAAVIDAPGTGPEADPVAAEAAKIGVQCDLLDGAAVGNGYKAISIWLHRNWRGALVERWGEHSNPHVLRRWRTVRRRRPNDASG